MLCSICALAIPVTFPPDQYQFRMDYTNRTDGQPTYYGVAQKGIANSTAGWVVYYYTFNGSNITGATLGYGSWDNRATLTYTNSL